jgi:plasmid maintenance system antidote protein VapI
MTSNPSPLHPGIVLSEVYMKEMNLNQTTLAKRCGCSPRKINEIVNGGCECRLTTTYGKPV